MVVNSCWQESLGTVLPTSYEKQEHPPLVHTARMENLFNFEGQIQFQLNSWRLHSNGGGSKSNEIK